MVTEIDAEAGTHGRERLLTAAFVRLTLADLLYFTAVGIAIFALPVHVTGRLGSGEAGAGLAFGAFAISALMLRPLAGRWSDRIGRRPLLVGGAILCAAATLATAHADSLALVVVLRLVLGVAEAAFFVAALAALADLAPPTRTGEALSYNSLGLYLGLALGPTLGELLTRATDPFVAWYGAAALAGLAAAVAYSVGETRPWPAMEGERGRWIHRAALGPALGFTAAVVGMGAILAFASLRAEEIGLATTSLPMFVYGAVVVISRVVFARVPDRLPPLRLAGSALIAIAVGLAVMAIWATVPGMIIGTVVAALGVSFSTPAFFAAIFATAAPSERGAASGTASVAIDLGVGGGPIVIGVVAQAAGLSWALGAGAAVALAGAVWTRRLDRR